MACGLPVILTKNCQGPDVIDNGHNGFIINEMDSSIISEKIKFFYDNPNKIYEMGLSSAKFAKENLSYDIMAKKITNFLEKNK
jgi:glycosyltransferase involved in cell wall biosynthesis